MSEGVVSCVISTYKGHRVLCTLCDGHIEDMLVSDGSSRFNVGDIVIGKVTELATNISSAFVDLGGEKGYLSYGRAEEIKPGLELPLLIQKEAYDNKEITVTGKLSIAGRYAAVSVPSGRKPSVHVSKKIKDPDKRDRLVSIGEGCITSFDITLRTKAEDIGETEIRSEILDLSERLGSVINISKTRTPFSVLYRAEDPIVSAIRDCRFGTPTKIISDIPEVISHMKEIFPDINTELYADDMLPLTKLFKIESIIGSVFEKRVWLKSGGYIVIDETEAMTVIDVNSGKISDKKAREDIFLKINLEASDELLRQLRIRDLSGMILVDFINMERQESYKVLEDRIQDQLKYDPSGCIFIDFTKLGIGEFTRQKKRRKVKEIIS